jgi:hypothetical protein
MRKFAIVCGVMVLPSIVLAQQPTSRTPQPQPFQTPQAENPTPQGQQQQAQPAQAQQQQHQQAQPPALAHPNQGQPPQLNMDEVKALGGGKADPNAPDQTVEPANGQPQHAPGQNMQPQQAPGQSMIPGGLR